jgi:hypothetical protein
MAPAKFPIAGVHGLAVAEFESRHIMYQNWGRIISDEIASELEGRDFFRVISGRSDFGVTREEMDPEWRDWGEQQGVDAVLVGRVTDIGVSRNIYYREEKHEVHTGRYRYETYTEGGQVKRRRVEVMDTEIEQIPVVTKRATIDLSVTMLDVTTGTRIDQEEYRENKREREEGEYRVRYMPDDNEMLEKLVDKIAKQVVDDLVPHPVVKKIKLLSGQGCKEGVKLAKEGRWEEAESSWRGVLAGDPNNHNAMYDLGVAAEVAGRYEEAQRHYLEAMELTGNKLYQKAWERANMRSLDKEKVDEQLEGRSK